MPRTKRQLFRLFLLRWHRRLGVALALFLIWLSATGIVLNHSVENKLDHTAVGWDWLRAWYSGGQTSLVSYQVGKHWISQTGDGYVYVNGVEKAYCEPPLSGAVAHQQMVVVACAQSLVLLTGQGEVLERIDSLYGLPVPLTAIAVSDDVLLLQQEQAIWQADVQQIAFSPVDKTTANIVWPKAAELPQRYANDLKDKLLGPGVNWERFILDLHSGQFFGFKGRLITDFFAFGMIMLALSGVWVWTTKTGRFKRARKD